MKLSDAIKSLNDAGIDNPAYEARLIFELIGKIPRNDLYGKDAESAMPEIERAVFDRCLRKPLQYIIGECGFYRETYKVTPACLIPREDTEILVDFAVKNIPSGSEFLDLCTGSGCVAISTLSNTSGTRATAVDISPEALNLAKGNAKLNGVLDRIELIECDVLDKRIEKKVFAVLSNPPYVTEDAYKNLEKELYYEPKMAFVGRDNGLEFYKKITAMYRDLIADDGFIAYEIGYDQAKALIEIADLAKMSCEIIKDFSKRDRVAVLRKK